jgi:hypothetical protein
MTHPVNKAYSARYLVLLPHPPHHLRALLFNGQHAFLAEIADDDAVVDNLVRAGTPCPPPRALPLADVAPVVGDTDSWSRGLQCYALG